MPAPPTARSYYTVLQQTDALALQPIIAGRYHDTFHRVQGEWCFETREMFVDLTGDLSHHLSFDLRFPDPEPLQPTRGHLYPSFNRRRRPPDAGR